MSTHPIMLEFLKIVIDGTNDMPFGKKSLGKSEIYGNFQFPGNWGKILLKNFRSGLLLKKVLLVFPYAKLFFDLDLHFWDYLA